MLTRRQPLKIPKSGRKIRDWTPGEDPLLGKPPDAELAGRIQRTYDAVAMRRLQKGIAPFNTNRVGL